MSIKNLLSYDLNKLYRISTGIVTNGPSVFKLARIAITEKQAVQRTWELMSLIGLVKSLRPKIVMEIGSRHGGTLFCWPHVVAGDALIISVDLPGGEFGGGYAEEDVRKFEGYLKSGQTLKCLRQDSHSPATLNQIIALLDGRKIDFLFIDGDHTYEGVRADFELYAPLVRLGGLIAFHDINANPDMPAMQVHRFWAEIKNKYQRYEFIDQNKTGQYGMGIGVLVQN
jgi:cephalosporin hydroxylase